MKKTLEEASQSGDLKLSLEVFVESVKQDFSKIGLIEGGRAQWGALLTKIDVDFGDKKARSPLEVPW